MRKFTLLYLIFGSTLLLPFLPLGGGLPELRPEWLMLVVFFVASPPHHLVLDKVGQWFGWIMLSMSLSMSYGSIFMGTIVGISDVFEFLKPLLYYGFYVFARSVEIDAERLRRLLRAIMGMMAFIAVIAIWQYFDPAGVLYPFLAVYADPERIEMYAQSRATATMANPNDLGMVLAIAYILTLFSFKHHIVGRSLDLLLLGLFLLGTGVSGSRTALGAAVVATGFFLFRNLSLRKESLRQLIGLGVLTAGVAVFVVLNAELFIQSTARFLLSAEDGATESWLARIESTLLALEFIRQSPFVGWGPNKVGFEMGANVDNEYILVLYRYGVLGLILVFGLFRALWVSSRPMPDAHPLIRSFGDFLTGALLGGAVFAYAAGIFYVFQLMTLLMLFLGLATSAKRGALVHPDGKGVRE